MDLVISMFKWTGVPFTAEINGKLTLVETLVDNSFLAFSAASLSLCFEVASFLKSTPFCFMNSSAR